MRYTALPETLLRYASVERSPLYTALLYAFGDASDRLTTSLTIEDVRHHLHQVGWRDDIDDSDLTIVLGKLVEWGLLDVGQNHTERYRTARDYERRNLQYALTRAGEATLVGHVAIVDTLNATGALQSAVLEAIAEKLDILADLAAQTPPTPELAGRRNRRTFTVLQELEGHLAALAANVKQFNGDLQRLLRAETVDETTFLEVKQSTVTYLQEYISRLDERSAQIRRALDRVRAVGVNSVVEHALEGADLPPHLRTPEHEAEWQEHAAARWAGLDAWFAPLDATHPRVEDLSAAGRRAILTLLQVIERMRAARRRPSSVEADFRQLARWFTAAPTDTDLHRLWRVGFGLHPSRHAHLLHPDPDTISAGTPWSVADPVPVSRTLRESGRTEVFSRTAKIRDVADLRRERALRARAEREQARLAIESMRTDGATRISQLATLEPAPFSHLLDMLGRALAIPGHDSRAVRSSDGRVELTLTFPADDARARLRTTTGELECPDFTVRIVVLATSSTTPRESGVLLDAGAPS